MNFLASPMSGWTWPVAGAGHVPLCPGSVHTCPLRLCWKPGTTSASAPQGRAGRNHKAPGGTAVAQARCTQPTVMRPSTD